MSRSQTIQIQVTELEIQYLNDLLGDEVFQLSGLKNIKNDSGLVQELNLVNKLMVKIQQGMTAQPA